MAGAFRMALARAKVVVTHPDGATTTEAEVTATVRDGVARMKRHSVEVGAMPATELLRNTSRNWLVTGPDGTTWAITKDCNCGGSR